VGALQAVEPEVIELLRAYVELTAAVPLREIAQVLRGTRCAQRGRAVSHCCYRCRIRQWWLAASVARYTRLPAPDGNGRT
jgi:hypothetical protein